MKKLFFSVALMAACIGVTSCDTTDGYIPEAPQEPGVGSVLENDYITITGATYHPGTPPASTTNVTLDGVDMSDKVMNGAMNYITVNNSNRISKFFVSVKNVPGYYSYEPTEAEKGSGVYVIPVMMSNNYSGASTIVVSGEYEDGKITKPVEYTLTQLETQVGALEVKLAFSNAKDVDLHLYTPSGEHIYFGHQGGEVEIDGQMVGYGLDIDSNAGCTIDNINKENIYIPTELVENGEYRVVVNLWSNCDASIPTTYSVVTRYNGNLITPLTGSNPATGTYAIGASSGDMTEVMTFKITNAGTRGFESLKIIPAPMTDSAKFKLEFED